MTDSTWDTDEQYEWLNADEATYRQAMRCRDGDHLQREFAGSVPTIDYAEVDWDQIYRWLNNEE